MIQIWHEEELIFVAKNKNKRNRNKTNKNNLRTQRTGQASEPASEKKSELSDDAGSKPATEEKGKPFDGVGLKPAEMREMIQYWMEHKDDDTDEGKVCKDLFDAVAYVRSRFSEVNIGEHLAEDASEKFSSECIQRIALESDDGFGDDAGSGNADEKLNTQTLIDRRGGTMLSEYELADWCFSVVVAERETQPEYSMSIKKGNPLANVRDDDAVNMLWAMTEEEKAVKRDVSRKEADKRMAEKKAADEADAQKAAVDKDAEDKKAAEAAEAERAAALAAIRSAQYADPVVSAESDRNLKDGSNSDSDKDFDTSGKKKKDDDDDKQKAAEAEAAIGQAGKNQAGWQFGNPNSGQGYANGSSEWNKTMSQLQMLSLMGVVDEKEINKFIVVETVKDIIGRDTTSSSSDAMQSYLTRPGASFADKKLAKKLASSRREYIDMYKGLEKVAVAMGGDIVQKATDAGIDIRDFQGSQLLGGTRKNVEKASRKKDRSGPSQANRLTGAASGLSGEGRGNTQEALGEAIEKNAVNGEPDTEAAEAAYVETVSQERDPTCRMIHKQFGAAVASFGAAVASKARTGFDKLPKFRLPSVLSRKTQKAEPSDGKDLPEAPAAPESASEQDQMREPKTETKMKTPEATAPVVDQPAEKPDQPVLTVTPDVTDAPVPADPDAIKEIQKNAEAGKAAAETAASEVDAKTEELQAKNDEVLKKAAEIAQNGAGEPVPDPANARQSTVLQDAFAEYEARKAAADAAKDKGQDGPTR